jgi:hypothetical protein
LIAQDKIAFDHSWSESNAIENHHKEQPNTPFHRLRLGHFYLHGCGHPPGQARYSRFDASACSYSADGLE